MGILDWLFGKRKKEEVEDEDDAEVTSEGSEDEGESDDGEGGDGDGGDE